MSDEKPVHKDIFGRELVVDDIVLISAKGGHDARLTIGTVKKLNPKMVKVLPFGKHRAEHRYSYELFCVTDDPRTTAYILTNSTVDKKRRR